MTNADRIRSMSDEELAVAIICPNKIGQTEFIETCDHVWNGDCLQCCLEWLRTEVEE